ncbi:RNA polymerase sigma factor [Halobacillus seohaensis]|uniref:RNA polymerase sigma factor n=1 Tax=Halobacillus seohaensis TaxID=447421 RepID=A0ABW2EJI4_9BACI
MSNKKAIISDWFHQYSDDVYSYLVYYTGRTDVEDLVQEAFIKASKGLHSYNGKASPKTWLFSIARNAAIDESRKKKNKVWNNALSFDESLGPHGGEETPEKTLLQNEEHQELYTAIQTLKKNYRDVLILRGIKEFSVTETAEVLNWKESKVRTNYYRALQSLRKRHGGRDQF